MTIEHQPDGTQYRLSDDGRYQCRMPSATVEGQASNIDDARRMCKAEHAKWIVKQWMKGKFASRNNPGDRSWVAPLN